MTITAGLDVGGAHLKVALVEDGRAIAVQQFRCRLWMGLEKLDTALRKARALLDRADRFAVTMTGEISDVFPDRRTGVETLVCRIAAECGPQTRFWMGLRGFGMAEEAIIHHTDVGSTNFLATATLVGHHHRDALLIDFGSTTADIVPIIAGGPSPRGLTDADRQATGELIYTGYTRTAVMAVTNRAPFRGHWVGLAREYLATMADIRQILGVPLDGIDLHATADGKGKSVEESVARFARMLGRDAADGTVSDWSIAAAFVREAQLRSIEDGVIQVISASSLIGSPPVVVAGIGHPEAAVVAARLGRPVVAFCELALPAPDCAAEVTFCAPAVSVAMLASARLPGPAR